MKKANRSKVIRLKDYIIKKPKEWVRSAEIRISEKSKKDLEPLGYIVPSINRDDIAGIGVSGYWHLLKGYIQKYSLFLLGKEKSPIPNVGGVTQYIYLIAIAIVLIVVVYFIIRGLF